MDLKKISDEIKEIVSNRQKELNLSFVEDTHTYFMKNLQGKIVSNYPSVSTVLKSFYTPFDAESTKSFKNCGGDPEKEKALLKEWSDSGTYASHMGSRVHFILEDYLVELYGAYKEVRLPIFECDDEQIENGDSMIVAGKSFLDLMHSRGAVLLDTEMVLGSPELGYTGQPDKVWLIIGKDGNPGILVTDWKSNKPKNFVSQFYTKPMLTPFTDYDDTSLGHYYVQLPLYAKLLLDMLKGSKYENIPLLGGIVVLLKKDATFEEYRIPKEVLTIVDKMNVSLYLK
tara:strand:- start:1428 stop:2282 length:855 start_codon:yes stop_codon:yes gene_type:complete